MPLQIQTAVPQTAVTAYLITNQRNKLTGRGIIRTVENFHSRNNQRRLWLEHLA